MKKVNTKIAVRMREEVLSRCGSTDYCLRLWSLLNPERDFDGFLEKLVLEEVARQIKSREGLYRFSLSDKTVSGILSSAGTWKRLYAIMEEAVEKMDEEQLLDLVLNRNLEGAVEL